MKKITFNDKWHPGMGTRLSVNRHKKDHPYITYEGKRCFIPRTPRQLRAFIAACQTAHDEWVKERKGE